MDDIIDKSQYRNWKTCLYLDIWIDKAIIESEILKVNWINAIIELASKLKINNKNKVEILTSINNFLGNIYKWELIDQELWETKNITNDSINKYFEMISLFTWWHIKYWFEIWQLLSNKKINNKLSKIAISLWIIRQICDDFNDYFEWHHEPFWDFINNSNRLPEILFYINWWNRKFVINKLEKWEIDETRNRILNKKVRNKLYKYCKIEENKIKKIKCSFDYKRCIEDYEIILSKIK